MAKSEFRPLAPPPATATDGGEELLRAAIINGGLHVSLRRGFDKAEIWGLLLADLARHASRIFARETEISEGEALDRIVRMFRKEMESPTDLGKTDSIQ